MGVAEMGRGTRREQREVKIGRKGFQRRLVESLRTVYANLNQDGTALEVAGFSILSDC
jgi:hypothetical protein